MPGRATVAARRCLVAAVCVLFVGFASLAAAAAPPQHPNVVLLFTDDQRADAAGALGTPSIITPNIDRLVERGFTFRNAYCFGSYSPAVCLPSRNMMLSGQTYFRFGKQADPARASLPAAFNNAGYETYHHGKRGNTAPQIQKLFHHDKYLKNDDAERRAGAPGKEIVDAAIDFLKNRGRDKPVLMYLAFANPHDPRVAAPEWLARYRRDAIPLPANYQPYHPFDNGEMKVRDERLAPWPRTPEIVRQHLHEYHATISGLDEQIGRLLAALQELGMHENTIYVFSSDHGLAMGSHGLFGKQNLYEVGMKAPLVFTGPGVSRGSSTAFAYLHDIFPTLCELCGLPAPKGIDGRSQAPVIKGAEPKVRDAIYTAYRDVQRAARHGPWKIIMYPRINKAQLFNLDDDPHETRDLAGDPAFGPERARMLALLVELQRQHRDTLPLRSATPAPAAIDLSFFKDDG